MGFLPNKHSRTGGSLRWLPMIFLFCATITGPALADPVPLPMLDVVIYRDQIEPEAEQAGPAASMLTEAVKTYLDASGLAYKVRMVPWTRLALRALKSDHTLVVDLLRIPRRENHFHWLLQLDDTPQHLIGLDKLIGTDLSDAALLAGNYRAICEAHSAQCSMFASMGFPKSSILQVFGTSDSDLAVLILAGRADFMIDRFSSTVSELKADGRSADGLAPLRVLAQAGPYLAAYKTLDAALLKQLQGNN
ncbi:MAG: hypothetical protein JKY60_17330 [Kordiimonadaceae bacterium]|nr:hypothetical protein [Kordiimonadaceae bacterium]